MTLLAWNCRGLAQAESKRSLKAIVNKICPDLLFLSGVKISSNRVKYLLYSLGFYKLECVEPRGLKGGIILGWKNGVDVEIVMSNDNMINGIVFSDPINEPWLLSMIYRPSARLGKQAFLEDLQKVGESFAVAWMCMGEHPAAPLLLFFIFCFGPYPRPPHYFNHFNKISSFFLSKGIRPF